eukprot:scaffold3892_cov74-Cyclotella_meneghiniana.AAC.1
MGPHVIHEMFCSPHDFFCCGGLVTCDFIEGMGNGRVRCSAIIQEAAYDLLYSIYFFFRKRGTFVFGDSVLCCFAVGSGRRLPRCVNWFCRLDVIVFDELLDDIAGHGDVECAIDVIPLESDAGVQAACSINEAGCVGDFVVAVLAEADLEEIV